MSQWPSLGFGVALKTRHYQQFLQQKPKVDWLEVHSENYIAPGGFDLHVLQQLRNDYPFSLHCVGLGLGSARGFSAAHLARVAELVQRVEPALVSDHLCWGALADRALNDLLPVGFNADMLRIICQRVEQVQDALRRPILLENVSSYLRFAHDACSEAQFLAEIVRRTGCGVLLDVNNLYVNYRNHQEDALAAIAALPLGCVGEIHLAGHLVLDDVVIDDHGSEVCAEVWQLYRAALARFGQVSSMVEWDTNVPELDVLLHQAALAREYASQIMAPDAGGSAGAPELPDRAALAQGAAPDTLQVQHDFGAALFDEAQLPQALAWFSGQAGSDVRERRFRYYRSNQRVHWQTVLKSVFPVMQMLVGEEFFEALAVEYGLRHPSQDPNLNLFGAQFAGFLQTFHAVAQYPYFPDMARLEWAVHSAYYAQDAAPADVVTPQAIAGMDPEQLDASCFTLHPACRLLETAWPVDAIWQAHKADPAAQFEARAATRHMLVARPQWQPQVVSLSPAAHQALTLLQGGSNLGTALDAALETDEEFPFIAQLQQWLAQRILLAA